MGSQKMSCSVFDLKQFDLVMIFQCTRRELKKLKCFSWVTIQRAMGIWEVGGAISSTDLLIWSKSSSLCTMDPLIVFTSIEGTLEVISCMTPKVDDSWAGLDLTGEALIRKFLESCDSAHPLSKIDFPMPESLKKALAAENWLRLFGGFLLASVFLWRFKLFAALFLRPIRFILLLLVQLC